MAKTTTSRAARLMAVCALGLAVLLVGVSGYIRLTKAGFGCQPWPACYGQVALQSANASTNPGSVTALIHRIAAAGLGLLVLGIAWHAFFGIAASSVRIASAGLLALTVLLAALGPWSASLILPAVNFVNLVGGVAVVALLGWLVLAYTGPAPASSLRRRAVHGGLALVGIQLVLGGLAAAHLAGPACPDLPTCQGTWLPGLDRLDWHALWQPLEGAAAAGGRASLSPLLDQLHRLTGGIVVVYGLALAGLVGRWRFSEGAALGMVFLLPPLLGIANVLVGFTLWLGLFHYLATVALVLALIRLSRPPDGISAD